MEVTQILPGLFALSLGPVNVFFLHSENGWTLIDTGVPNSATHILAALAQVGNRSAVLQHIIVTHAHPDHIGSLAALKRATNATTYIHQADAPIARTGTGFRPLAPAPGLRSKIMFRRVIGAAPSAPSVEGAMIDYEISAGDVLPIAGGLTAVHTPGHCAGHLAFLWPKGQVLFVGDACSNMPRLGWSIGYENVATGKQSLKKLAKLDFEVACFGHGTTILHGANTQFRKRWL